MYIDDYLTLVLAGGPSVLAVQAPTYYDCLIYGGGVYGLFLCLHAIVWKLKPTRKTPLPQQKFLQHEGENTIESGTQGGDKLRPRPNHIRGDYWPHHLNTKSHTYYLLKNKVLNNHTWKLFIGYNLYSLQVRSKPPKQFYLTNNTLHTCL